MIKKLRFILPALVLSGVIAFGLTPHYTEEDESYYRAVFCSIDHSEPKFFLRDMENLVEGGNSDYALHKNHYIPALGEKMLSTWQKLNMQEQSVINEDQQRCGEIMSEKQH